MKIIRKSTEKSLIDSFKEEFKKIADKKHRHKNRLSFVLKGGPIPINLYKKLSKLNIDWKNIDIIWGDERYVAKNSKNSNYHLVKKNFFKYIKVKNKQVFSVNTNKKSTIASSKNYSDKIKKYFKNKKIIFDIILLGMGNDGHVASIFPKNLELKSNKITRSVKRKDFKRISITLKTINNSRFIFLWLNTKKRAKIFSQLKNQKKKEIPVSYLKSKKTIVFSLK